VVAFSSDKYIFSNADYDDNCFSMNYSIVTTFMTHYEKEKKDVYVFAKQREKIFSYHGFPTEHIK
jgi:aromatic ring-opening dioxygenase catalytic subunit (LigB family)